MPLVDVKKQNKKHSEEKALAKRRRSEVSNWGNWHPFAFSVTPTDFSSTSPFALMRRLSMEMDRAFGRFFGQGLGDRYATWVPAIEVTEHNGQLQVRAELPGLRPEDVKIEVTDDSLIIQGERKYEHEEKKKGSYRSERRYGQFFREIPLPEGANVEQVKAQFNNGMFEITIPGLEQTSKAREIPIQSGSSAA
jgi:HSP20 family protein